MAHRSRQVRFGFTLIELMIVVAIIGILAAVALPKFADLIRKSKEAGTKGNLGALRSALSIYYADNEGEFPTDHLESLTADSRYLQAIPRSYVPVPTGHPDTNTVYNNDNLGLNAILMEPIPGGYWHYWNWTMGNGGKVQGDLWIGCVHTDARGSTWSTF